MSTLLAQRCGCVVRRTVRPGGGGALGCRSGRGRSAAASILDPASSTAERLVFGSDLTAHQREGLDLLVEYYVAVWLALSVLWIAGQLVRWLLVRRIDDDVFAVAST